MLNALTVDVEDYFHVSAFAGVVSPAQWDSLESRVCANTERLLELFAEAGVRATFFVLGWVAERYPQLIRRIHAGGHELASHSYDHRLVYELTPEKFRADLGRARTVIEQAAGVRVVGYRAPSYSITSRSLWALDVLIEEGYLYDASIYPVHHDRYGIPDWNRHASPIVRGAQRLLEIPGSTVSSFGFNLPIGGGGYFRFFPYWWTARGIRVLNTREGRPAVFYLHPWEIDPDQPRIRAALLSRARHYHNLHLTERRLRNLLRDFRFGPIRDVFPISEATTAPALSVAIREHAALH